MVPSLKLSIQRASLKDLPTVYKIYFETFQQSPLQGGVIFDTPARKIGKLSLLRTLLIHFFHIFVERLYVISQTGGIAAFSQSNVDMVPLKIVADREIIGFCFLKRCNPKVFEVGLIGLLESKRQLGIGSQTIELVKQHVRKMGASRLTVRASGIRQVTVFFTKCGFKQAFSEGVF